MQLSDFAWADLVIPIGGDGTFLLAANMIFSNKKPIIGINSNPLKSAGYLLLSSRYTDRIPDIFEALKAGYYSILMRRRIRVTLIGEGIWQAPFHMHEKEQTLYRYVNIITKLLSVRLNLRRQLLFISIYYLFIFRF
jgi:NAD+ kinase